MKRIATKRLVYYGVGNGKIHYGGEEYDGKLTDDNILGSVHEVGKTQWMPAHWREDGQELYLLNKCGDMVYRIEVETFYHYEKSWYNLLFDSIKRILRM